MSTLSEQTDYIETCDPENLKKYPVIERVTRFFWGDPIKTRRDIVISLLVIGYQYWSRLDNDLRDMDWNEKKKRLAIKNPPASS